MEDWRESALCRQVDPELWFPEKGGDGGAQAKRICGTCPVRARCEDHAIEAPELYGVWGGKSPTERRKTRVRRGLVHSSVAGANRRPIVSVSTIGLIRRRQALACMGYGIRELAVELGLSQSTVVSHGCRDTVHARTAARWRDMYLRLSGSEGPNRLVQLAALRAGWLPPSAWDEATIEDPAAQPRLPEAAA